MAFFKMVDMHRTPQEKAEDGYETGSPAMPVGPDYPYGLCLCLDNETMAKLNLDADCSVGDMIDVRAMCKVTSASEREVDGKPDRRIELQIVQMGVEDEGAEDAPAPKNRKARYG